jgi:hypothetical protein
VAAPSRLLNVTVNVLFNRYLSDVYTGYKVFTRKAFEGLTLTAKTLPSRWNSPRTLFVTVAVFAALTLRNVIEWRLSRLAWVLGVGASVGVLQVVAYFTLLSVGDNPAMRRWWVAWYVPVSQGPGRAVAFVVTHTGQALTSLGPWAPGPLGAGAWPRRARPGGARPQGPAGGGAVGAAALRAPGRGRRRALPVHGPADQHVLHGRADGLRRDRAGRRGGLGARALADRPAGAGADGRRRAAGGPGRGGGPPHGHAPSTVRQQVEYVLAHRRPGDVVVPGFQDIFAFAYYWPDRPTFSPTRYATALVFHVDYPDART